jgi:hypothetical protein
VKKSTLVTVLSIGIAIGACAREIIRETTPAAAQAAGSQGRYHTIFTNPADWENAERELNAQASAGWHYVGMLGPGVVILERDSQKP